MATNNWVLLSAFQEKYKAVILITALEEKQIECKMVDKVDSMFHFIGDVEVFVRQSDFVRAMHLKENIEL